MRERLRRSAGALAQVARATFSEVRRLFGSQLWSSRTVAILGVLLALMGATEQGFFRPLIDPSAEDRPEWWDAWSGWITLGLTLALLLASTWFGADVRRMRRWSTLASELQARSLDVESVHPDALTGTLITLHDPAEAADLQRELQAIVAEVNLGFADGGGMPTPDRIRQLETLATRALTLTREGQSSGGGDPNGERTAAWDSMARLRAAARQARIDLESSRQRPLTSGDVTSVVQEDPRRQWTDLVGMVALLVGLLAAPAVADEINGDTQNGSKDAVETDADSTIETDAVARLADQLAGLELATEGLGERIAGLQPDGSESPPGNDGARLDALDEDLGEIRTAVASLEAERNWLLGLPSQFGEEVLVEPGDSIWGLVSERCGTGDSRSTVDKVVRVWRSNVEVIGANPDEIKIDQVLVIPCGSVGSAASPQD